MNVLALPVGRRPRGRPNEPPLIVTNHGVCGRSSALRGDG